MIRMCGKNGRTCDCEDAEAHVCLGALIADFLETLQWNVMLTGKHKDECFECMTSRIDGIMQRACLKHVDGSPGDLIDLSHIRDAIDQTTHSFSTVESLKWWMKSRGYGFLEIKDRP